jgi:hypothetical protein
MRKIAVLFAAAGALIMLYQGYLPDYERAKAALAMIPGVAPSPKISVADPMGDRVIPMQMMTATKDLPHEEFQDYSFVFGPEPSPER